MLLKLEHFALEIKEQRPEIMVPKCRFKLGKRFQFKP
jgi:hypothetical protein